MKQVLLVTLIFFVCSGFFFSSAFAEVLSNYELTERLNSLEENAGGNLSESWINRLTVSGVIEVEVGYEKLSPSDSAADDESSSAIALATIELGVDAEITDHVSGSVLFLYESGEDIVFDEGFILLSGEDVLPLYLKVGEFYVPFGIYESHMISDPLTLELGEMHESAIEVGFELSGLYGSVYVFNGDIDKADEDSHVDNFGAVVGYAIETDDLSVDAGFGYINSLMDSNGWSDALAEELEEGVAPKDYVAGFCAYVVAGFGPFSAIGEYVAAADEAGFDGDSAFEGKKPAVFNVELAYSATLAEQEVTIAAGYQGTGDAEAFLPESRYLGSVGVGIFDATTLALEYLHDEYDSEYEVDVLTAQLAIEF